MDHDPDHNSDDGRSTTGSFRLRPSSSAHHSPIEGVRASNSFDSRESRPTSPHNVSSPSQWGNPHNFLAVPNTRSRGASIDSEVESAAGSDITYVNSQAPTGLEGAPSKVPNDDEPRLGAGGHPILPDSEALRPDPGTEEDFTRDSNPFAFAPGHLTKMLNPKSLGAFHALGGLSGIEKGLRSDRNTGLSVDESQLDGTVSFEEATATSPTSSVTEVSPDAKVPAATTTEAVPAAGSDSGQGSFNDRRRIFGENRLPERKPKNILQLMWLAYNDKVLIVLTIAAGIALALGVYQAVSHGGVDWIEGVAIIVAIIVVVMVGAINDWQKERQFAKLNKKKESRNVKVVRSGRTRELNIFELNVGDVLLVEIGDILPVDGILISGHGVRCDESSATGESDILKKTAADEVYRAMETGQGNLNKMDPFMISGGKVTEGVGRMLVTSVGTHSSLGKTMLNLQESNDMTPLQSKLNKLAEYIAKLGSAAAILLFIILLIIFLAELKYNNRTPEGKGQQFMTILITAVTIIVVAVPEGLPLAVTLALAYATKRMLKDRNLVRVLRSCETMGNATTICSDKTGTLTQNVMTVVAGTVGTSSRFTNRPAAKDGEQPGASDATSPADGVPAQEFISALSKSVKTLLKDSIAINSTAFESEEDGKTVFVGSKTESALLDFARHFLAMDQVSVERDNAQTVQVVPFDSLRKCMGVVVRHPSGKGFRLLVKGASEVMLRQSISILRDPTQDDLTTTALTTEIRGTLEKTIDAYASRSLRTIGFLYRDFEAGPGESWPPRNVKRMEDDPSAASFPDMLKDMTFIGLVGIQDPLRPGVMDAVADCIRAGVFPRMVTGDNLVTAKAIATECGIYTPGGVALEGPDFRRMSRAEQRAIIPKLQVLARSSPDDKRVLVRRLKEMGETVAVTGDGTNDAPAMKAADVGFAMNIAGTEVAKEASDIILMDDNFASIVSALMWGRAVNDAVRKFLQFQITVNITAVLLAFISAVSNENQSSVLSAVQLLWVNLIMDTMAALALATDPPTRSILDRKPDKKSAPLISVTMWKMIIGQAIYQLTVTLVLYFAGAKIFDYDNPDEPAHDEEQRQLQTMIFNTFVWMQIFNALNNRRLDNRFNVFEGILNNWFFIGIWLVMIGGQVLIIFVGGWPAFQAEHQFGDQWAVAIILGAISIPIGVVIRLIPDELAKNLVPRALREFLTRDKTSNESNIVITDLEGQGGQPFEFNHALFEIKEELAWLKKYKGGRLNNLKFAMKHPKEAFMASRSPSRSRAASASLPRTPNNESASDEGGRNSHSPSPGPPTPESRHRRSYHRRGRSRSNSAFAGAAMAGIVAGSIAGGFTSPIVGGAEGNPRVELRPASSDAAAETKIPAGGASSAAVEKALEVPEPKSTAGPAGDVLEAKKAEQAAAEEGQAPKKE